MKGYSWRVHDGVLEMAPQQVFQSAEKDLLTKLIPEVAIDDNVDNAVIRILEDTHLAGPYGARAVPGGGPMTYGRVSMRLKNVTVRDALNAIVRRDGKSLWHFIRSSSRNDISVYSWREQ
jgi:hypothetical protein